MAKRDGNRLLTLDEAAAHCNVATMVVHRWINRNFLTVCFTEDGDPRFRLIDVERAYARHMKASGKTTRNIPKLKRNTQRHEKNDKA